MKSKWGLAALMAVSLAALAACGGGKTTNSAADTAAQSQAAEETSTSEAASAESSEAATEEATEAAAADGTQTTVKDIQDKGELVIGLDDTFAPMGFRDESGELVGFDIDLATAVCEELGVTAKFQPIAWDAKELELSSGRVDCLWNGMSSTPDRQESMSLSKPYLNNRIIVMTNPGIEIQSKEDLKDYYIGIQAMSAALETLENDPVYDTIPAAQIVQFPTYDEVIMDMGTGRLDCMVIDEVLGNYKNNNLDSKFGVADFDFGDDLYVIGFRKADVELTNAVDEAISALKANGKAAEISNKWFGEDIVIAD